MRHDMARVAVERERRHSELRGSLHRHRKKEKARDGKRAPLMGSYSCGNSSWDDKSLNEHLNPVIGFLRKNVGRPWAKVHSEMAAVLRLDSAVQSHVLDHVRDMVVEDVQIVAGKPFDSKGAKIETWGSRNGFRPFYVDPRNGLLRAAPHMKRWRNKEDGGDRVRLGDEDCRQVKAGALLRYIEIKGIWYRVKFAEVPPIGRTIFTDLLLKSPVNDPNLLPRKVWKEVYKMRFVVEQPDKHQAPRVWGASIYAIAKKQISKREKKKVEARWEKDRRAAG